ncbi:hypothetical protein MI170_32200 [Mycolicibacterium goodii]|nr:hypothetical protein [Mycolicibacterium goodii]UVI51794.1 hypothetical protein MI170_32200 [Mycolicibacterium goodii]
MRNRLAAAGALTLGAFLAASGLKHDDGLWYLHNTDSPTEHVD